MANAQQNNTVAICSSQNKQEATNLICTNIRRN